jgi:hypothetical protein
MILARKGCPGLPLVLVVVLVDPALIHWTLD